MVEELEKLQTEKDVLSKKDPNEVIEYKALNIYNINNPMLNSVKQEVEKHFIFDKDLNIIRTED